MNQSIFRPVKHLKMTVWTSFLWKINIQLAKKWPEMVVKLAIVIVIRFYSDYILLHKLLLILSTVHPQNGYWKKIQTTTDYNGASTIIKVCFMFKLLPILLCIPFRHSNMYYSVDSIKHTVFLIEIFWKIDNSTLDRDSTTQNLSAKRYSNVRYV